MTIRYRLSLVEGGEYKVKTYMWTLDHCQIIITAESKEDAVRIALADTHLLNLTKDTISKTDPKEYTGSILGIFSKYNYIVEVEDDLNKG
jgi:hypothetical protein